MQNTPEIASADFLELTGEIVSSYVSSNDVPSAELPGLIGSIHSALAGLAQPKPGEDAALVPRVPDPTTLSASKTGAATSR